MSRVGKNPIPIPEGVKVTISDNKVLVKGPKGELSRSIHPRIKLELKDDKILVMRVSNSKMDRSLHGLSRTLIANMIIGTTQGYSKELEIHGVGYKAQLKDKSLNLSLGFSHQIDFPIPEGIEVETPKPNRIFIKGRDKELVGEVAAEIRTILTPEPYKGKGIRYAGEYVRRKAGKTVA